MEWVKENLERQYASQKSIPNFTFCVPGIFGHNPWIYIFSPKINLPKTAIMKIAITQAKVIRV